VTNTYYFTDYTLERVNRPGFGGGPNS